MQMILAGNNILLFIFLIILLIGMPVLLFLFRKRYNENKKIIKQTKQNLAELQKINERIEEQSKEKSLFYTCLIHEIKTPFSILKNREKEVLQQILKGLLIKEIADTMCLSIHTARNHIRHIFESCKVQNKTELLNIFMD